MRPPPSLARVRALVRDLEDLPRLGAPLRKNRRLRAILKAQAEEMRDRGDPISIIEMSLRGSLRGFL